MDIVEEFEELKPILQEKWLDFYFKNRGIIIRYLTKENDLIELGNLISILISIEPKLLIIINNYMKVCDYLQIDKPSLYNLWVILEVDNNVNRLDKQVKERQEKMKNQIIEPPSPLDEFRNKNV